MARGRPMGVRHQEDVRKKIQASQLINRLTNHVTGDVDMSPTQVRAAEILLKKCMPDLSQISGTGEDGEHEHLIRWESMK